MINAAKPIVNVCLTVSQSQICNLPITIQRPFRRKKVVEACVLITKIRIMHP
jgi:hypothetical protein